MSIDKHSCGLYFHKYSNNASSKLKGFIFPRMCENVSLSDVVKFGICKHKTTKRMSSQHLVPHVVFIKLFCSCKVFIDLISIFLYNFQIQQLSSWKIKDDILDCHQQVI